jgi:hypothetical protein
MFKKLAGMTGTAVTEAGEFLKIYKLDVIQIPTNLPMVRLDQDDTVFRTEKEKWKAISDEIARLHEKGQPVLVGTTSVEKSEKLSGMLQRRGVKHEVLNAKQHEREAHIVAMAGEKSSVTVATNMAGRGTDIKLGGNFEHRMNKALEAAGLHLGDLEHLKEIDALRAEVRARCQQDEEEVLGLGGLYVLGTERHEARRIDNQLRGRSGRQGNVGESRFYLSLQDDLMRIFYRDWVTNFMEKLGMAEGVPIESGMVTRAIARAQKKVEDRNFEVRKNLLEYDEVMDQQRHQIYAARQKVLEARGTKEMVLEMLERAVNRAAHSTYFQDKDGFLGWYQRSFGFEIPPEAAADAVAKDGNPQAALDAVAAYYEKREAELTPEIQRQLERYILLNAIDGRWKDHLHAIDSLKAGIGLRGYGQVDPKTEYKREGFQLFENLLHAIEDEVTSLILRIRIQREAPPPAEGAAPGGAAAASSSPVPQPKGLTPGAAPRARPAAPRRPRRSTSPPAARSTSPRGQQMLAAAQAQRAQAAAAQTPAAPMDGSAAPTNGPQSPAAAAADGNAGNGAARAEARAGLRSRRPSSRSASTCRPSAATIPARAAAGRSTRSATARARERSHRSPRRALRPPRADARERRPRPPRRMCELPRRGAPEARLPRGGRRRVPSRRQLSDLESPGGRRPAARAAGRHRRTSPAQGFRRGRAQGERRRAPPRRPLHVATAGPRLHGRARARLDPHPGHHPRLRAQRSPTRSGGRDRQKGREAVRVRGPRQHVDPTVLDPLGVLPRPGRGGGR